jgi:1,4-dihydroxy-2-naphthoate octaprenyltransferase
MRNKGEIVSVLSVSSVVKKIAAYAKLLRLSNAPTAVADVWMGYAVATGKLEPTLPLCLMTAASLCLYHGGMALNDVRDAKQDAIDNRNRPIAAGLISYGVAKFISRSLLLLGLVLGVSAGVAAASFETIDEVLVLLVAIVAYNGRLKRTLLGPILMGVCRSLNAALGMSLSPMAGGNAAILLGIFVYVVGLTVFARDESKHGHRRQLALGLLLSIAGLAWLALMPLLQSLPEAAKSPQAWTLLWIVTSLIAIRGMVAGILQPTPRNIGRGVGIAIQGLVVIDATLATLYAGPVAGLAILALLPVTMLLSRWIPQT